MSDLNDPRVLFAAERTLLAWSRTSAGLMAFGFLVDRAGLVVPGPQGRGALWIGVAFVLVGVALSASLRPVEIPPGYWVNFSVLLSAVVGLLGLALAGYLVAG